MDTRRIHAVTQSISEALSRRSALRGLAATIGLAALTPGLTGARKGKRK